MPSVPWSASRSMAAVWIKAPGLSARMLPPLSSITVRPSGLVIGPVRWMLPPPVLVLVTSTNPPPAMVVDV